MTATLKATRCTLKKTSPVWHAQFLDMLPTIRRRARVAFRDLPPQPRHDAVEEVVADALVAFARLIELGKGELAYANPLAQYAIKHVREGRQIGCRQSVCDVMSRYAQQQKGFQVDRLDCRKEHGDAWREILVEDKRATPAEVAASRIDFAEWLRRLPARYRRIAKLLATSESTCATAEHFGLSPARISQIRHELHDAWRTFQGEIPLMDRTAAA